MLFLIQLKNLFNKLQYSKIIDSEINWPSLIIWLEGLSIEETRDVAEYISTDCSEFRERTCFKVHTLLVKLANSRYTLKDIFPHDYQRLFIDGKYHDIENTLTWYLRAWSESDLLEQIDYITVHSGNWVAALQGLINLKKELSAELHIEHMKFLWVTLLTSLNKQDSLRLFDKDPDTAVRVLSEILLEWWLDWIVCSGHEAKLLRDSYWAKYNFEIVTPWVRLPWAKVDDQSRIVTPAEAIINWADHIVMSRPILWSKDIPATIREVFGNMDSALK